MIGLAIALSESRKQKKGGNMVSVLNTLTLGLDKNKVVDYPKWIKDDCELSPRTRDFQLAIFGISVEQNTPCPLVSDQLIAKRMNLSNERGIRRYVKISTEKNKVIKIKGKEKGHYHLAFLYNPNESLAENQILELEDLIDAQSTFYSLSDTETNKSTKKSNPTPRAKKSGKSLPKTQNPDLATATSTPELLSPPAASTPELLQSLLPSSTPDLATPDLATLPVSTPESPTPPSPSPLILAPIGNLSELAKHSNSNSSQSRDSQIASMIAKINNFATATSTNTPTALETQSQDNLVIARLSLSTPRESTFAIALLAKEEEDKLQAHVEPFYDLTEEQEDLLMQLSFSIGETWERIGLPLVLKREWEKLKSTAVWENFLSEKYDERARLEATRQFLSTGNLANNKSDESAKTLAIQNAINYWEANQPSTSTTSTTTTTTTSKPANTQNLVNVYQNQDAQINQTKQTGSEQKLVNLYQNNQTNQTNKSNQTQNSTAQTRKNIEITAKRQSSNSSANTLSVSELIDPSLISTLGKVTTVTNQPQRPVMKNYLCFTDIEEECLDEY